MSQDNELNIYPIFKDMLTFIDAMVKRGAINGDELMAVANMRQQVDTAIKIIESTPSEGENKLDLGDEV